MADPPRPGAEEGPSGGGGGKEAPQATSSGLRRRTDGKQIVEQKKKQRKKRRKKSDCLDDSCGSLIMEMPFAEADIEEEFSTTSRTKANIKKKRKRTTGRENEEDSLIKKKKKNQDRPNYFISIPIINPQISDGIQALQNTIIEKDGRLSKAMVHYGSLHVTLLVMHLSSETAVDNAIGAFLKSKGSIEELLQGKPLDLSFQGIDHFRNQVGFVKLTENESTATLLKIAERVKSIFLDKDICIEDERAFKPHLTFMKLSKSPELRKQGVKKIDPSLFENFRNHYFGDESMTRLDLCSMFKKKQSNGYYHCESSITIALRKTTWASGKEKQPLHVEHSIHPCFTHNHDLQIVAPGKSHEANVLQDALRRELSTPLSKLNKIKVLLASPEIRMKMYKELLGKGLVSGST